MRALMQNRATVCFEFQPCPLVPQGLQRALSVSGRPPSAQQHLQQEYGYADEQADRVSAVRGEVEADGEIYQHSDYGLADVVCQAHPAIPAQAGNCLAEPVAESVREHEGGYQYEGESQFLPHVEGRSYGLGGRALGLHRQFLQGVEGSESCRGYCEDHRPCTGIVPLVTEHLPASEPVP